MTVWMLLVGTALLALAGFDVIVTTISTTSAGGPVTSRVGHVWWRIAHRLARRPTSRWLSTAGPVVLLTTIVAWLLLVWAGWTLLFAADTSAVVASTSQAPADFWSRVYFAGFTIFTLGVGDYVPTGAPWQVLTVLASATGLAITTASITYLIPVVTAATDRARLAARINVAGGDAYALVTDTYHEGSITQFGSLLSEVTDSLLQTGERHLTYPILHYFHPRTAQTELRVQLSALDDAITLVEFGLADGVERPHPAILRGVRAAIGHLLERADISRADGAPALPLGPLREAGLPVVTDAAFAEAVRDLADHRARVAAYASESGWGRRGVGG